ncbi:hypothetical protein [Chitinophaga sp. Cy-1792]|uniref:hypothetical protein n=1 Tax=Chitinophaga sp. Cy-1792 TaxID=2608339 RepID=UPI00141D8795|nr:hypothetical protein [Chitinophaga sp. Cy-1792]NIG56295.1 hypothetical protein [Chitinophaga sp. Cy-1792]
MNTAIKTFFTNELTANKSAFLAINNLHPLLAPWKEKVSVLNVETNTLAFFEQLEINIREWWTNPETDIDVNAPLYAVLFEYNDIFQGAEIDADAYGISVLGTPYSSKLEPFNNNSHYDFADGFYAVPGITMDCWNDLAQLASYNIDEEVFGEIEIYKLEGYEELLKVYLYHAYLALHSALQQLYDQGKLDAIRKQDPCYFLIGEHDCGVQPVFIISSNIA